MFFFLPLQYPYAWHFDGLSYRRCLEFITACRPVCCCDGRCGRGCVGCLGADELHTVWGSDRCDSIIFLRSDGKCVDLFVLLKEPCVVLVKRSNIAWVVVRWYGFCSRVVCGGRLKRLSLRDFCSGNISSPLGV